MLQTLITTKPGMLIQTGEARTQTAELNVIIPPLNLYFLINRGISIIRPAIEQFWMSITQINLHSQLQSHDRTRVFGTSLRSPLRKRKFGTYQAVLPWMEMATLSSTMMKLQEEVSIYIYWRTATTKITL